MAKTRQQVAAEIKQLLQENDLTLKTVTKYYGPCEDCYDEYVYVADKNSWDRDYEPMTVVTSI